MEGDIYKLEGILLNRALSERDRKRAKPAKRRTGKAREAQEGKKYRKGYMLYILCLRTKAGTDSTIYLLVHARI